MRKQLLFSMMGILLLSTFQAQAGDVKTYMDGDLTLEGYYSPSSCDTSKGTVLVTHQWMGLGEYERGRADMLAEDCYNAFAVDVYGQGIRPANMDEAKKESSKYKSNPELARRRMKSAIDFVKTLPQVSENNLAIIGYCFGGTMALEVARSGADIDGVVSFHGGLSSQEPVTEGASVSSAILVHHGDADPHVKPEEVAAFKQEMRAAKADWQFVSYADAVHAFTEKHAGDDPSNGAAYNAKADQRSWAYTLEFLDEIFK